MTEYIRLQVNELTAAHWEDSDILSYIANAVNRFMSKTYCAIEKATITTDGTGIYLLTYRPLKDKGAIYVNVDGNSYVYNQVSKEDWERFDVTGREDAQIYYLDKINKTLYLSTNLTGGLFYFQYYYGGEKDKLDTIWANAVIPEDYHEDIARYCLSLFYERDKDFQMSRYYRDIYMKAEEQARQEFFEREPSNVSDDFSFDNNNPHRDETDLLQSSILL